MVIPDSLGEIVWYRFRENETSWRKRLL